MDSADDVGTPGYRQGGPLPVSLSSFRPVRDQATGEVVVRWITQSELNNAGFNILRSEAKDGEFEVVNLKGIIPGTRHDERKSTSMSGRTHLRNPTLFIITRSKMSPLMATAPPYAPPISEATSTPLVKLTTRWGELKTYGK